MTALPDGGATIDKRSIPTALVRPLSAAFTLGNLADFDAHHARRGGGLQVRGEFPPNRQ